MSEYRELRQRHSLLDICRTPDLATAVTLQPVRRIEIDAAILFQLGARSIFAPGQVGEACHFQS